MMRTTTDKETPDDMLSRLTLIASGERECDLSDHDAMALAWLINCHRPLLDVARTVVAVCDSGKPHIAELACMETSPLVDAARAAVDKVAAGYQE